MNRLPFLRCLSTLALAAALLFTTGAAAEPVVHAPERVTAGSMFIVRTEGIDKDSKFNWHPVGGDPILADLLERQTLAPVLLVQPDREGTLYLVLAYLEDGAPRQISVAVIVGKATPPPPPDPDDPDPPPTTRATAATYVYEKDQHVIPVQVLAALNRLNRERGIVATVLEADTTDGTGEVPEQYRVALEAAKAAGLPCLVVTGAAGVIRVVKNPTTEQAVLDAVPQSPAMRKAG